VAGAVEGLIPLEELPEDEYVYDEGRLALLGRREQFRFGMPLSVRCAGASVAAGEVWFRLSPDEPTA
jgi:Exoribonuclease R